MMEKKAILIVDDEIEICLNIKDMLGYENLDADYVTTAREALEKISSTEYKLILTDIKLEGRVTGIDIIKELRDKIDRPKIIVISAIPRNALDPIFEKERIEFLIHGYLDKPSCSNPEKLMQLVKRLLAQP